MEHAEAPVEIRPIEQPAEQPRTEPGRVPMHEEVAAQIRQREPAVAPERQSAAQPMAERQAPQAGPAWKMEPVALPPDLVMIETQSKAPLFEPEQETPRRTRTPRPRHQPPLITEEPLQQVETGKGQPAGGDAL